MKILAIDTSCDETTAAVTENTKILSNVIWSQAASHAKFGGVMPSLAQRMHEERIDFVVEKAIKSSKYKIENIDAIAVTVGPGLSIALGVGVNKAKELAKEYKKPLIPINHIEAHLLSPLAKSGLNKKNTDSIFPAFGLVVSGGNTIFVLVKSVGDYKILAETHDDALGEALDKAARLLGFGYPGGAVLEKMAKLGNPGEHLLPTPLVEDKIRNRFSYSGLKTAFVRLVASTPNSKKEDIQDLAAVFQNKAFLHITRVLDYQIFETLNSKFKVQNFLLGGGVANNSQLRKELRKLCKIHNLTLHIPFSKKLLGDNAGMIGVCAYLKNEDDDLKKYMNIESIDRDPKLELP